MHQGGARGQNLGHLKKSFFFFAFIFLICNQSYTTQNLIRNKLLVLFAEGPAYLIPNIL